MGARPGVGAGTRDPRVSHPSHTYPGHYSPVEAGQLGVVVGNLFFDDPGERQTEAVRLSSGWESSHVANS